MQSLNEWGEFLPPELSYFCYNETMANDYFPISKEEAIKHNFRWTDYKSSSPVVEKVIQAEKLPDSIEDIPDPSSTALPKKDNILNWAIICEKSEKPFRIVKQELRFYRKMGLPVPRLHPDERYLNRFSLKNPRKLWQRKCDKCEKDIQTSYAPERPERVFCEDCYLKEVY